VSKITMVLEILGDGKWHRIEDLLLSLNLSEHKFRELTSFLNAYSFVKVDEKNGRVRIDRDFKKLLTQIT
jgi:DNA-binding IclR family transcriptional regulator